MYTPTANKKTLLRQQRMNDCVYVNFSPLVQEILLFVKRIVQQFSCFYAIKNFVEPEYMVYNDILINTTPTPPVLWLENIIYIANCILSEYITYKNIL